MRAYCDFYRVAPDDADLVALCRALIANPDREGIQLIARDEDARAVGVATIYWTWSTAQAGRPGVMNDLFVAEGSRGVGIAEALIDACRDECARRGVRRLAWQTAPENRRAQAVYERIGATRQHGSTTGLGPVSDVGKGPIADRPVASTWCGSAGATSSKRIRQRPSR